MLLTPAQQLQAMGITLADMAAEAPPEERKPRFEEVKPGPELLRIRGLPRRPIPDAQSPEAAELARFLTSRMAKVQAPYPGTLTPTQALALQEAFAQFQVPRMGGVFSVVVGGGKTLLCRLMIEVVRAQRPLYICPSANVKGTTKEFRKLESFWHVRPTNQLMIESYEMLAHPNSGEDLDTKGNVIRLSKIEMLQPTDVFLDEAHKGAGDGTGASRIEALADKYPHIRFWLFTGTLFTESIKPPSKLMSLALRERSPLPDDYLEREMWAQHLDARANAGAKVGAGALMDFLTPDEAKRYHSIYAGDHADRLTVVRKAVSRWVYETPGVFGTETPILDTPLTVEAYYPPAEDDAVEEAFCKLLGDGTAENPGWILPDGEQIIDGLQFSAYAFDYGQGYFRTNDPPPPPKYRLHRLSWARWCRRALKYNKRGIDSEARMQKEVRKGLYNDKWTEDELRALLDLEYDKPIPASHQYMLGRSRLELWEEAKRDYFTATGKREPPVRAEWISDEAIEAVGVWCNEHPRGVVWVNSIPLGEQLARALRLPYYGAKGLDARKRNIEAHALGTPAIASVKANGTGKNLQRIFQDNLWLTPPGEQAMGRTHRQGTDAAVVRNYVYLGCAHHLKAYLSAESVKARFTEEMQFGSRLKIRYAETCMPDFWELEQRGGRRYEVPDKEQC